MKLRALLSAALISMFVALVACSSDTTTAGSASTCDQASTVATDCNAKSSDSGTKVTINFDKAKCEASDKKAAQCVVDHKDNCDCFLSCALTGTCS